MQIIKLRLLKKSKKPMSLELCKFEKTCIYKVYKVVPFKSDLQKKKEIISTNFGMV